MSLPMSMHIDSTALKANLSPKRLVHSLAVTDLCHRFNERYHLDLAEEDLDAVGLGHDIARSWSEERLRTYIEKNEIALHPGEEAVVDLLHAPVGAHLLKTMGCNEEVVRAVRYHTLGSTEMGTLGFVLFASDYLDPNRTFLSQEERELFFEEPTIEDLVLRILERSVRCLDAEGKHIFEPTKELLALLEGR